MGKQSRNQQASTKSVKMSPFLFFTLLIVASSGFEVNQKAAAGYENRRLANLSEKLIPANLREKLIQANLRESLFSGLSPSSVNLREKLIRDKSPKPLPSKPVLTKGIAAFYGCGEYGITNKSPYTLFYRIQGDGGDHTGWVDRVGTKWATDTGGIGCLYLITSITASTEDGVTCSAYSSSGTGYRSFEINPIKDQNGKIVGCEVKHV